MSEQTPTPPAQTGAGQTGADDASFDYGDNFEPREDETVLIDGRAYGSAKPASPQATEVKATDAVASDVAGESAGVPEGGVPGVGLAKLIGALRTRRARGTQLVIAALCGLLGFAGAVQIRLQADDSTFTTARQSDLISILDDLNDRSDRLELEIRDLEQRRSELRFGTDRSKAALTEAQERRTVLGILAGTVAAKGPGITLTIQDPARKVDAAVLLDTLQELRDAGAEAVQINDVRVVASTDFLDGDPGSVRIGGTLVSAPYEFRVIGEPETLGPALRIPGGVFAVLTERGATGEVQTRKQVVIDALHQGRPPEFARAEDAPN
ncbi:MAG: DUF881 domain-containing protein [Sporichthyaceae bacterium]